MEFDRKILLAGLACLGTAATFACSSDPFDATGGSLPPEVTQDPDSIAIEAAPIYPVDVQVIEPELSQEFDERNLLYLGERRRGLTPDRSRWALAPILQFDFTDNDGDPISLDLSTWQRVYLKIPRSSSGANEPPDGFQSWVVASLNRQANVDMLDEPLANSVGDTLIDPAFTADICRVDNDARYRVSLFDISDNAPDNCTGSENGDTNSTIVQSVRDWILAGTHDGITLIDRTIQSPDSCMSQIRIDNSRRPRLWIEFKVGDEELAANFPANYAFTHVEREDPPADHLRVGTHLASRSWLRFDLTTTEVPNNATINKATLQLHPDNEFSYSSFNGTLSGFESELGEVATVRLIDADRIRRSSVNFVGLEDSVLSMDVTEFYQRFVNGLVGPDVGIMLGVTLPSETGALIDLELYGPSAPVGLRPRLDVRYTPPADFRGKR